MGEIGWKVQSPNPQRKIDVVLLSTNSLFCPDNSCLGWDIKVYYWAGFAGLGRRKGSFGTIYHEGSAPKMIQKEHSKLTNISHK